MGDRPSYKMGNDSSRATNLHRAAASELRGPLTISMRIGPDSTDDFNFNDSRQLLLWNRAQQLGGFEFRSFASTNDAQLLGYLASRSIAAEFLTEIDQFLQGHPEIASTEAGRTFLQQISAWSPLDAYKWFVLGYLNPARYINSLIKTEHFELAPDYYYYPLSNKYDQELMDWIRCHGCSLDILHHIDWQVNKSIRNLRLGRAIPPNTRKLMSYCIWGNSVDAFKYYMYSYQQDHMPHRYLAKHSSLWDFVKPTGGSPPQPSFDGGRRKYGEVRRRMARANDQGVDVLVVPIAEHKEALVHGSHQRHEIERLNDHAKHMLEAEHRNPTGVDIVDMIMDDATSRRSTRSQVPRRRAHRRPQPSYFTDLNGAAPAHAASSISNHLVTELQEAKKDLIRLYAQEYHAVRSNAPDTQVIYNYRRATERRYVDCLVSYLRSTNRMSSAQGKLLQDYFVAGGMAEMEGGHYMNYLIAMWSTELSLLAKEERPQSWEDTDTSQRKFFVSTPAII